MTCWVTDRRVIERSITSLRTWFVDWDLPSCLMMAVFVGLPFGLWRNRFSISCPFRLRLLSGRLKLVSSLQVNRRVNRRSTEVNEG